MRQFLIVNDSAAKATVLRPIAARQFTGGMKAVIVPLGEGHVARIVSKQIGGDVEQQLVELRLPIGTLEDIQRKVIDWVDDKVFNRSAAINNKLSPWRRGKHINRPVVPKNVV